MGGRRKQAEIDNPPSLVKTVNFRFSGKCHLKLCSGKQWRTTPTINSSCPLSGTGEHSVYTKYTHVHNATKWLFYDFHFVSYTVCAYVHIWVCVQMCRSQIQMSDVLICHPLLFFFSNLEMRAFIWSSLIWLDWYLPVSSYPSVGVIDMDHHLLPLFNMISGDSNSVPFACAIGMEFYPQSYLLCPYLFFKYIYFSSIQFCFSRDDFSHYLSPVWS